jgi:hypothetical protein
MRQIFNLIKIPFFAVIICSALFLQVNSGSAEGAPMGNNDLKLFYGAGNSIELFVTQYKGFTELTGNSGWWEDADRYQYTWKEGQAGFIKTGEMRLPQLVQVVLSDKFRTPRGIRKGSALAELLKVYPGNYEITEVTDGKWYVFRWTAESALPLVNGRKFSLSFYVKDGLVNSVFLKLEGKETENIPVG